jgi:hypothetical protein
LWLVRPAWLPSIVFASSPSTSSTVQAADARADRHVDRPAVRGVARHLGPSAGRALSRRDSPARRHPEFGASRSA